jgi:PIN domain nuclease of toxin-antitoxin system
LKKILLDAHAFLWWLDDEKHQLIGPRAKKEIMDQRNDVYVSAATAWEISIKSALGNLNAPEDVDSLVEEKGFLKLPITLYHGQQAGSLPVVFHANSSRPHKDPFDRLLIAQAQADGMYVLTKDTVFSRYNVRVITTDQ